MSDEVCVMLYHISFILPKLWSEFYSGNIFGGIPQTSEIPLQFQKLAKILTLGHL